MKVTTDWDMSGGVTLLTHNREWGSTYGNVICLLWDCGIPSRRLRKETSLSTTTIPAGSAASTLTVTGTDFVSDSVVRWNGTNLSTTYVDANPCW